MKNIIIPAYLPTISYFSWLIQQKKVFFANNLRFQKQTFRNRTYIYGPNGKLRLVVPIVHDKNEHRTDSQTHIFNQTLWKDIHWRSLCSAYRSSSYFEYYEDRLYPLYQNKSHNLFDFNLELIRTICQFLSFELEYQIIQAIKQRHRIVEWLLNAKNQNKITMESYPQVFDTKHGFIPNLSIVDLLFNLGPESLNFLKKINIKSNK